MLAGVSDNFHNMVNVRISNTLFLRIHTLLFFIKCCFYAFFSQNTTCMWDVQKQCDLNLHCLHMPFWHNIYKKGPSLQNSLKRILCAYLLWNYGKCPKISNILFHTFLAKIMPLMQLIPKLLSGKANRVDLIRRLLEEPSDLGQHCLHMPLCQKLWWTNF